MARNAHTASPESLLANDLGTDLPEGFDYQAYWESLPPHLRMTPQERYQQKRDVTRFKAKCRTIWKAAMKRAASQNVPFTITLEWVADGLNNVMECAATGIPFRFTKGHHFVRSLDRIKPDLGYTPENCRWVIYAFNSAKGVGTDEDVMMMAEALVRRKAENNGASGS